MATSIRRKKTTTAVLERLPWTWCSTLCNRLKTNNLKPSTFRTRFADAPRITRLASHASRHTPRITRLASQHAWSYWVCITVMMTSMTTQDFADTLTTNLNASWRQIRTDDEARRDRDIKKCEDKLEKKEKYWEEKLEQKDNVCNEKLEQKDKMCNEKLEKLEKMKQENEEKLENMKQENEEKLEKMKQWYVQKLNNIRQECEETFEEKIENIKQELKEKVDKKDKECEEYTNAQIVKIQKVQRIVRSSS